MSLVDVNNLVLDALGSAAQKFRNDVSRGRGNLHRRRSQEFVSKLGIGLEQAYEHEPDVITMWQGNDSHRRDMGMNELLFDVSTVRVKRTPPPRRGQELSVITEVLWSVESEFAINSRETVYDFNKLVMSTA